MPDKKITLDEALALMDKHEADVSTDASAATDAVKKKIKEKEKIKDLLKAGAKQGRGGLGLGTSKQLKALDEEDTPSNQGAPKGPPRRNY